MPKTIIVSNRLPVKANKQEDGDLSFIPSEGGLATGLGSVYRQGGNIWIGWPGLFIDNDKQKSDVKNKLEKENMLPVYLTENEIRDFYEGFSNETLWPMFHYFAEYAVFDKDYWNAYEKVNKKFTEIILAVAKPGDTIWVHDYQLMLVPQMIRDKLSTISIGFFLHIPFPSHEIFRLLPWRKQILAGLLGSDLLGFHTYDDMRHFLSSISRIVGKSNSHGQIETDDRPVIVDAFPMGIDYDKYEQSAYSPETLVQEVRYRTSIGEVKLMLSIDRLDYSKGIPQRLRAFEIFLEKYPEYKEKVSFLIVVVPSRDKVHKYKMLKERIDLLVGKINGQFGTLNWTPVHYFYRSFSLKSISAFYRMADVAIVTPMRDGMNLVCKEYIASKIDKKGVLVLSEMAGASKELSDAILINPNDIDQLVSAMHKSLTMPIEEQKAHFEIMQKSLKRFNIHHWVNMFMERLKFIKEKQKSLATRNMDQATAEKVKKAYQEAENRILFFDYDGTLIGFVDDPNQVKPDEELMQMMTRLTADKKNRVVIITGRGRETIEEWFKDQKVDIIAEHGVWLKKAGKDWKTIETLVNKWKEDIHPLLEDYVNRTPGSFIEEKDYSLVWHYRKVETGLGELRTRELTSHLKYLSTNANLQVLEGSMIIEIKNFEVNKGRAAAKWIKTFPAAFSMAIGDDWTDEDTFKAMPDDAVTIKVGSTFSAAKYNTHSYKEVRKFLNFLME